MKRLTVKDIVEGVPNYAADVLLPFEGIPDLLRWILEQGTEKAYWLKFATQARKSGRLRYFFF